MKLWKRGCKRSSRLGDQRFRCKFGGFDRCEHYQELATTFIIVRWIFESDVSLKLDDLLTSTANHGLPPGVQKYFPT